jgi:hypothetical protein
MKLSALLIVGLAMSFSVGEAVQTKKTKGGLNGSPIITSFSASPTKVVRCITPIQIGCTSEDVLLTVVASDPDGDKLTYRYSVSGGTIIGEGSSARWTLKDISYGNFVAQVFVSDGRGGETMSELSLNVTSAELPDPPPCPTVSVACPESVRADKHSLFMVDVAGGPAGVPITYHWSVSGGTIVKGQDTGGIEVEAVDRAQESITVRVRIGGYHPNCSTEASCTTYIVKGPRPELIPPPCPHVDVTCPGTPDVNRRAIFSASVREGELLSGVTYYWTVNWGKIISGQGTSKIEVEHKDKWGEKLTATVSLGGYDPSCFAPVASCSVPLE